MTEIRRSLGYVRKLEEALWDIATYTNIPNFQLIPGGEMRRNEILRLAQRAKQNLDTEKQNGPSKE